MSRILADMVDAVLSSSVQYDAFSLVDIGDRLIGDSKVVIVFWH